MLSTSRTNVDEGPRGASKSPRSTLIERLSPLSLAKLVPHRLLAQTYKRQGAARRYEMAHGSQLTQ
jgi:hypothetical protein